MGWLHTSVVFYFSNKLYTQYSLYTKVLKMVNKYFYRHEDYFIAVKLAFHLSGFFLLTY